MTPDKAPFSTALLTNITIGIQENDLKGVITYSNPAHHRLLGYAPGELVGKTIFDMLHTSDQRQSLEEYLAHLIAERPDPTPYISTSFRKDGTPVPTKTDWNYLYDESGNLTGFVSAISDFSEYHELQKKLQVERDLARHYLDTAQFMMLILDEHGHISLVNHELCKVLGYSAEQLIGKNWFRTCVPKEHSEMIYELFKDMIAGRAKFMAFFEAEALAANGDIHLISWRNSEQHDSEGRVCGYICSGEDITERRQIEKEKLGLQDELQRVKKMEAVNRLTAGIAHDFNNILANVLGYADMALDVVSKRGDRELQRYLTEVINAGEKACDLIKQMLVFSRGNPTSLPPLPLAKEIVKVLQESAGSAIQLSLKAEESIPDIEMAPQQFHQLLLNTITGGDESMSANQAKQISISLGTATLNQQVCHACNNKISGKFVEITISDDGQGIAPETLNELFNPLPSTKYTTATRGLLMAQGILHNHHGHIAIESTPGFGTTTRLYIPMAGSSSLLGEKPVNSQMRPGTSNIMIVDNEAAIAHLKRELLSLNGCEVEVFSDSITALKKFQQLPDRYDCVLIRYNMPSLNGIELAHQLLALRPKVAIALFAPAENFPDLSLAEIGTIRLVKTPISPDKLTALIHEVIGLPMQPTITG